MIDSFMRMAVIAHNALLEALRQKVLLITLLFSLVCIGSASPVTSFALEDQLKIVKDFSFGAMSVFGLVLAIFGAAQMMRAEIDNRTIYTILSKPIRRAELLWGKFFGLCALILLSISLMTAVFLVVITVKEHSILAEEYGAPMNTLSLDQQQAVQHEIQVIRHQAHDPLMIRAWILLVAKLLLTAGMATLVSTVSTSTVFTIATTLLLHVIGHLQSVAREVWFGVGITPTLWQKCFAGFVAILVPDFGSFGVMDDILAGSAVSWHYTLNLVAYTGVYLLVVLLISQLIFERREF